MQQRLKERDWRPAIRGYLTGRDRIVMREVMEAVGAGIRTFKTPQGPVIGHLEADLVKASEILAELGFQQTA